MNSERGEFKEPALNFERTSQKQMKRLLLKNLKCSTKYVVKDVIKKRHGDIFEYYYVVSKWEKRIVSIQNWSRILKNPNQQSGLLGEISSLTYLRLESKHVTLSFKHRQPRAIVHLMWSLHTGSAHVFRICRGIGYPRTCQRASGTSVSDSCTELLWLPSWITVGSVDCTN